MKRARASRRKKAGESRKRSQGVVPAASVQIDVDPQTTSREYVALLGSALPADVGWDTPTAMTDISQVIGHTMYSSFKREIGTMTSKVDDGISMSTTPEAIAYRLLLHVMEAEGRPLTGEGSAAGKMSRNLILDAYADCLSAVRGERERKTRRA